MIKKRTVKREFLMFIAGCLKFLGAERAALRSIASRLVYVPESAEIGGVDATQLQNV